MSASAYISISTASTILFFAEWHGARFSMARVAARILLNAPCLIFDSHFGSIVKSYTRGDHSLGCPFHSPLGSPATPFVGKTSSQHIGRTRVFEASRNAYEGSHPPMMFWFAKHPAARQSALDQIRADTTCLLERLFCLCDLT